MIYLSLFLISLFSGLLVFYKKEQIQQIVPSLLSFSGAYLIGICFLHLLPELFAAENPKIGFYLMLGFFLQLILDYFSGGIEHGHIHQHSKSSNNFPWVVFLSLSLHAFLETFPLVQFTKNQDSLVYLFGLLIHKAPIAFVLAFLLFKNGLRTSSIILALIVFSLFGPLGAFFGKQFNSMEDYFQPFFAISVGIILHLATTILIENNESHSIQWKKLYPLLIGALFAFFSLLFH